MAKPDHPMQRMRDIMEELGGNGAEYTIPVKVSGLVDFGKEVQLMLPDGVFTYLPTDTFKKAIGK